jgi:hypothetical protein
LTAASSSSIVCGDRRARTCSSSPSSISALSVADRRGWPSAIPSYVRVARARLAPMLGSLLATETSSPIRFS